MHVVFAQQTQVSAR